MAKAERIFGPLHQAVPLLLFSWKMWRFEL